MQHFAKCIPSVAIFHNRAFQLLAFFLAHGDSSMPAASGNANGSPASLARSHSKGAATPKAAPKATSRPKAAPRPTSRPKAAPKPKAAPPPTLELDGLLELREDGLGVKHEDEDLGKN